MKPQGTTSGPPFPLPLGAQVDSEIAWLVPALIEGPTPAGGNPEAK